MIEALKLVLKALNAGEHAHLIMNTDGIKDKVRQAIAELESQEPVGYVAENGVVDWNVCAPPILTDLYTHPLAQPPQRTEQNFCPRCGKRTNDIHTCTPPMEKNNG
jgi:hypothetical protein